MRQGGQSPMLGRTSISSMKAIVPPDNDHLARQLIWLVVLAIPIASISRTLAQEEIFREPREWCKKRSEACRRLLERKFFYVFTCEYCLSHWVTFVVLLVTRYRLLFDDWRGYVVAFFSLVFVANAYLNLYARLRVDIAQAKVETKKLEAETKDVQPQMNAHERR